MMPASILIVGGSGWLGQHLYAALVESGIIENSGIYITYTSSKPSWVPDDSRSLQLDLSSDGIDIALRSIMATVKPAVIVNLAALSSPVKCQQCPDLAMKVNRGTILIETIHECCPDALYIFTSSDLVYDGEAAPYEVLTDGAAHIPKPINDYGLSKLSGEEAIKSTLTKYIILRLSNMIGPKYIYRPNGAKFLQFLYESAAERRYVGLRFDEIRSFVFVSDVNDVIIKAIENFFDFNCGSDSSSDNSSSGNIFNKVYNVGGADRLSRLNLAEIVAEAMGISLIVDSARNPHPETTFSNSWRVYRQSNQECILQTGVLNPRDVSMDSSTTEKVFRVRFKKMNDVIPRLLSKY